MERLPRRDTTVTIYNCRNWETAGQDPSLDDSELKWAALWNSLLKVVFSATLPAVQGNARLASGGLAEEIERLRAEPAEVLPGAEDADEGGIRDADVVTRKGPAAGVAAGLWW
jgi:hypothetical protein